MTTANVHTAAASSTPFTSAAPLASSAPIVNLFGAPLDTGNLGVSALGTATLAGIARRLPGARLVVFDNGWGVRRSQLATDQGDLALLHRGVRGGRRVYRPESLAHMAASARISARLNGNVRAIDASSLSLDISAGDSFTDLYGAKRFAFVVGTKQLVLQRGRSLVLLPQTYGPFTDPALRAVAADVVAAADAAWARDADSYASLQELLGARFDPRRHRQGVDAAFALPTRDPGAGLGVVRAWLEDDVPVVGINVSGLLANDPAAGSARFGLRADYRAAVDELIRRLLSRTDVRVLLTPHVRGTADPAATDTESDDVACRRLAAAFDHPDRLAIVPPGLDAAEIKWVISRCAWFTGARMHATIAALSTGVPTTGVAYSPKMRGVFASCGLGEEVVDARTTSTTDLVDALWGGWERRVDVARDLGEARGSVIAQANRQFDEILAPLTDPGSVSAAAPRLGAAAPRPGAVAPGRDGARPIRAETGRDFADPDAPHGLGSRVERLLPAGLFSRLRRLKYERRLLVDHLYDYRRTRRYTSAVERGDTQSKLAAMVTLSYHGVEKGLALRDPRPGFGRDRVRLLLDRLDRYIAHVGSDDVVWNALNTLAAYRRFNTQNGVEDRVFDTEVARLTEAARAAASATGGGHERGGTRMVTRTDVQSAAMLDLRAFFASRSSVRDFADRSVDQALIDRAVGMAQKTPSVCNRQSSRAWQLRSEERIARALELQGGARGFAEQVGTLLVITSDLSHFQSEGERNQCWVDGGMFAMSVVYGLHSLGLGTCCLNWSKGHELDQRFHTELGIPDEDAIIMLVAVGHLQERFRVAQSPPKRLDEALGHLDGPPPFEAPAPGSTDPGPDGGRPTGSGGPRHL